MLVMPKLTPEQLRDKAAHMRASADQMRALSHSLSKTQQRVIIQSTLSAIVVNKKSSTAQKLSAAKTWLDISNSSKAKKGLKLVQFDSPVVGSEALIPGEEPGVSAENSGLA